MLFNELPVEQYTYSVHRLLFNVHHNAGDSINVAIIIAAQNELANCRMEAEKDRRTAGQKYIYSRMKEWKDRRKTGTEV